ncbi:hypothetical protein RHA1_ro08457 (plasmid) [Rhodococcus jostii RHA1]|uniref:Uncharacterized protein n=1 Tax=Rhodococcus jostii (strain RHA1) TaxID=101510 RepID=Q0RYY5_RHOJR|nr:hypothetical protein RHA1_ro08457 [Rhodococcus jostii RHA1]
MRELAEYSEALTAGQLSERITGRFRPILEHSWDGEGWVRSGETRLSAARAAELRARPVQPADRWALATVVPPILSTRWRLRHRLPIAIRRKAAPASGLGPYRSKRESSMNVRSLVLEISRVVILARDDGTSCVATPERLREVHTGRRRLVPCGGHHSVISQGVWSKSTRRATSPAPHGGSSTVTPSPRSRSISLSNLAAHRRSPARQCLGHRVAFLYRSDRPEGSQPHRIRMTRPNYLPPAPYPDNHW